MKKRLLLTLLPLALLVAACSGGNGGGDETTSAEPASTSGAVATTTSGAAATSTSAAAGTSTSAAPATQTTSATDTTPAATSSAAPAGPSDIRAKTALDGTGVEVKVGSYYYTMPANAEPDSGMAASYTLSNLTVTAGEKIVIYASGEAVEAWAQADTGHNTYPNYNERPTSTKYSEFTVTTSSDAATMYVHETSTGDYQIWLTPTNDGTSSGGGEQQGGGSEPSTNECVWYVCGEGAFLEGGEEWAAGGKQMSAHGDNEVMITLTFSVGDTFKIVQKEDLNPSEAGDQYRWIGTWHTKISGEGCKGTEFGASASPSSDGNLVCSEAGTYDIYVGTSDPWNVANNHIWIQAHAAE